MNSKLNPIKLAIGAATTISLIASAHMIQPAKEQINIVSPSYHVVKIDARCFDFCPATLATEDEEYEIKVEFKFSLTDEGNGVGYVATGAEIDQLDIISVEDQLGEEVNAYIDRFEIERINDALVEGILRERRV